MNTLLKTNTGKIKPAVFTGLLDPFFKRDIGELMGKDFVDTIPSVNIAESDRSYHVEMAAPGLKKDDFIIKIDNDVITISCEKETETKEVNKEFTRREYNFSSFSRSFNLPEKVDQDKIMATYSEGILKIDFQKKVGVENTSTRKIKVS